MPDNERKLHPYDGWENDVELLATCHLKITAIDGLHFAPAKRLVNAFEPAKCGKVLHHEGACASTVAYVRKETPSSLNISCNLPVGHHPFNPVTEQSEKFGGRFTVCTTCERHPEDPIHSPGHVPDVSESAWR